MIYTHWSMWTTPNGQLDFTFPRRLRRSNTSGRRLNGSGSFSSHPTNSIGAATSPVCADLLMSAFGTKRTSKCAQPVSALRGEADMTCT
jgi:hypothetical protein